MQSKAKWFLIILLVLVTAYFINYFHNRYVAMQTFMATPILSVPYKPKIYILKSGENVNSLARDLHKMGLITDPNLLIRLAIKHHLYKNLKAGEYAINPGVLPLDFLQQIADGKVLIHSITFVEGWKFEEIMDALNKDESLSHTLKGMPVMAIMSKLGFPYQYPEGHFFPDTYNFTLNTPDIVILTKAHKKMQTVLDSAWQHRDVNLPYKTPDEALIAASLIEKETAVATDRPMIARVIINRLEKNMPLQIDPTVIYALGEKYTGKLSHADLSYPSPYNTYLHTGLPPTPIAMPGMPSIDAALHPAVGPWLYFVVNGTGGHQFSATLQQHNAAVHTYLTQKGKSDEKK